jgi:hypothetical protein
MQLYYAVNKVTMDWILGNFQSQNSVEAFLENEMGVGVEDLKDKNWMFTSIEVNDQVFQQLKAAIDMNNVRVTGEAIIRSDETIADKTGIQRAEPERNRMHITKTENTGKEWEDSAKKELVSKEALLKHYEGVVNKSNEILSKTHETDFATINSNNANIDFANREILGIKERIAYLKAQMPEKEPVVADDNVDNEINSVVTHGSNDPEKLKKVEDQKVPPSDKPQVTTGKEANIGEDTVVDKAALEKELAGLQTPPEGEGIPAKITRTNRIKAIEKALAENPTK